MTASAELTARRSVHRSVPRPRMRGPIVAAVRDRDADAPIAAASLLAAHGAHEMIVLHVLEPLPLFRRGIVAEPAGVEFEEERRAVMLNRLRRSLVHITGSDQAFPIEVVPGTVPHTIVRTAQARHAPLLVVGIGRHRPVDRLLAGEEALRIIREASMPVLAVAPGFSALPTSAVAAIDFSPASIVAAQEVLGLLGDGATLFLVHVWNRESTRTPELLAREAEYERDLPEMMQRVADMLEVPAGVELRPVWFIGDPVAELLAFAEQKGAELIAVGRRGSREWYERLLVGSVATRLVRGAGCSVLVAPEPGSAERERIERLVTGESTRTDPAGWQAQLVAFSQRNAGRRTVLEVDDPDLGAQSQEVGYTLLGATYDPRDRRVDIMLGGREGTTSHLTRAIGGVMSVSVLAQPGEPEHDAVLRIEHGRGQTLLMFLPPDSDG